jgi:hypothetical protein
MYVPQEFNVQQQIDEAVRRAKCKKALYLYDETGNRELLGVFSKSKVSQIRTYLKDRNLLNRLTEFEVLTTEPDTQLNLS